MIGELPPAAEGELVTKNSGPRAPRIGEKELAGFSLRSELAATAMSALRTAGDCARARVDGMNVRCNGEPPSRPRRADRAFLNLSE